MIKYKNFYFLKSNKNKKIKHVMVIKPIKVRIKYLNLEEIIKRSQIKLPGRLP